MELRQLRYFVAVAEELHFGRAAQRLHMTQPPLSQSIQLLEEGLGAALFLRNRRGVTLSPAGAALLPEARRILSQAADLPALAQRAAKGEAGKLTLSFVSSADYSVLPPLLKVYRQHYPNVQIVLQEATSDVQFDDLHHQRIDAGMVIPPLADKAGTEQSYFPLLREPLILAAQAGSIAAGPVKLADLAERPLIIFPRLIAPGLHDAILTTFRNAGITPAIAQEAIQMQTIVSLVSAGMGIALVPQSVSNLMRPGVEYRALDDATPSVETGLAWRKDNPSPVLAGFLEIMRKNTVC